MVIIRYISGTTIINVLALLATNNNCTNLFKFIFLKNIQAIGVSINTFIITVMTKKFPNLKYSDHGHGGGVYKTVSADSTINILTNPITGANTFILTVAKIIFRGEDFATNLNIIKSSIKNPKNNEITIGNGTVGAVPVPLKHIS